MSGNKADQKKNDDQDNDDDSDDKKLYQSINKQFHEQAMVMAGLFNFLNTVVRRDIATFDLVIEKHSSISNILKKGILQSENQMMRQCIANRVKELIFPVEAYIYHLPLVAYKIYFI